MTLEQSLLDLVKRNLDQIRSIISRPSEDDDEMFRHEVATICTSSFQLLEFNKLKDVDLHDATRSQLNELEQEFFGLIRTFDWLYCKK